MRGVFLALIQEETTGIEGAADAATKELEKAGRQTQQTFLDEVGPFFDGVWDAIISPQTIAKVIVASFVVALGVIVYRALIYGAPRVLSWRNRRREEPLDEESVARIKRRDTAITLVRTALRYLVLIVAAPPAGGTFLTAPSPPPTRRRPPGRQHLPQGPSPGRRGRHGAGRHPGLRGAEFAAGRDRRPLHRLRGPVRGRGLYRGEPPAGGDRD